jgi:hypothetical protein
MILNEGLRIYTIGYGGEYKKKESEESLFIMFQNQQC